MCVLQFAQNTFTDPSSSSSSTSSSTNHPHDPFYEKGCRHPITLDDSSSPLSPSSPSSPSFSWPFPPKDNASNPDNHDRERKESKQKTYLIDALEFPTQHLLSNPLLEQALAITECAVLVYDVRDEASFRLARGVAEFVREHFSPASPAPAPSPSSSLQSQQKQKRLYGLVLIGTKTDCDEDPASESERQVSFSEGSKAAAAITLPGSPSGINFLEVSAKTGENVSEIFPMVGREVLRLKKLAMLSKREQAAARIAAGEGRGEGFVDTKAGGGGGNGGRVGSLGGRSTGSSGGRRKNGWLFGRLFRRGQMAV